MLNFLKSHHPARRAKSFKYAFKGIFHALINEPNFRIQIILVLYALFMGIYFEISNIEWGLLILSMGFLLSAEMVNTVVENFLDHLIPEEHDAVRIIKDLSAGFVLVTAFTAFAILILIFAPKIVASGVLSSISIPN